jgi:PAS domain S-box-containing protein
MLADALGHLVQQSSLLMLTLDLEGKFTGVNPAAERLMGRDAASLIGQPLTVVLDPYSHAKAALMLERALAEGQVAGWELDHRQPAGPPVLVAYTATRLQAPSGQVLGVGAIGRRLSDQLELTDQLAQANQQLEGALLQLEKAHAELQAAQAQLVQSEKMRALGQMVAGVAHELNNPAAFIANNLAHLARLLPSLQALYDAYAPLRSLADPPRLAAIVAAENRAGVEFLWQDLPDLVHDSQDGITRISNIVQSLRNFSRMDDGDWQRANLADGLRSTLQLLRPLCADRIQIIEEIGVLPETVCRPGELNQVFLNLIANAMQAIAGHGQIWVTAQSQDDWLRVTVRDTGCGMSPQTLARLGEPFFTTKVVGAGTGLGLAISLALVERHHGRLRFESQLGQGTTAMVELPVTSA